MVVFKSVLFSFHLYRSHYKTCERCIDPFVIIQWLYLSLIFYFKSTLTDINIAKPTFFLLLIAWNIFSKAYTWSLYMSLQLKCVSLGSIRFGLFCNPATLYLLIAEFNPFIFYILLSGYLSFHWFCSFCFYRCKLFLFMVICSLSPFFMFCVSDLGFYFVVTMKFTYIISYINCYQQKRDNFIFF